jgi:hypothetical protein
MSGLVPRKRVEMPKKTDEQLLADALALDGLYAEAEAFDAAQLCACGHVWDKHVRTANGALACTHYGCGCRDVVEPSDVHKAALNQGQP